MALLNKKSMLGESVRCSLFSHSGARANRLKITICSNGNNSELFKTPVNRLYIHMPKNDESLYGVTPSFSLLWVSADHVLVKGLGANRDQFLPPSLLQTVNENYEQGTTDTKSQSGQEGFMSSQSDNNYKIENGEKKSFTLQQCSVISIIYVFHTNHILIFVAFDIIWKSLLFGLACRLYGWNMQTTRLRKADDTLFPGSNI